MSVELEKARELAGDGKHKAAVRALWVSESYARTDTAEARGLLELATRLRQETHGRLQRDCELLIEYAKSYVGRERQAVNDPAAGAIALVSSCRLLGGSGVELGSTDGRWDLIFKPEDVLVKKAHAQKMVRLEWVGLNIEIGGAGAFRSGMQWYGGGFGVEGAAEGALIATALNALTSRTKIDTVIRLETPTAELFLHNDHELPQALRRRISVVFTKLRQAAADTDGSGAGGDHVIDRLDRLGAMLERGLITQDEFAKLKAELLSSIDG